MYHSKIAGLGFYVPENVVTNDDLSKIMNTNDEWIQEADFSLEIPQFGTKHSLNVSVSMGVVIWDFVSKIIA